MLAFLGDIHGDHEAFQAVLDEVVKFEFTALIQVGDFGWYKNTIPHFRSMKFPIPVYFIDGNHEEFPLLRGITEVTEMSENLFFIPRGTVLTLDDRKVAFMGGAASVDKAIRLSLGADWYDDENIRDEEIRRLDGVEGVDILVTHAPPQSIVQKHFDPRNLLYFGLPVTWKDQNADKIERLWAELGYPQNFCGHMHRSVVDEKCRILNINELFGY